MKFGHDYQQDLEKSNYPQEWIDSAISYGQLKKCIKQVQQELAGLGLDNVTLQALEKQVSHSAASQETSENGEHNVFFEYTFSGGKDAPVTRLVFTIETADGVPVNAALSPETRTFLMDLARDQESDQLADANADDENTESAISDHLGDSDEKMIEHPHRRRSSERVEHIEVPLNTDSAFFNRLSSDVSRLDTLQTNEEKKLSNEITSLGDRLAVVTRPDKNLSKTDLYAWRHVLEAYLDSDIFWSDAEVGHGARPPAEAAKRLELFMKKVHTDDCSKKFRQSDSMSIYTEFMQINQILLQNLRFIDLQRTAATKILKKFDKRTALGVKQNMGNFLDGSYGLTVDMSKAICATISQQIVSVVPQLDDYLCPVCTEIAFKPVRLGCGHLFCIRCMIKLQTTRKIHCPMCREEVVMAADSANLDPAQINFLKFYFPIEVKQKDQENRQWLSEELYGPMSSGPPSCSVM